MAPFASGDKFGSKFSSMPNSKQTVTLKDIAKQAGVSPGAVSFVLNNTHEKRRISKPTVERVRRIARELGYMPNIAARNLRLFGPQRNLLVIAIITSTNSPLHLISHIFDGLQKTIKKANSKRHYVTNIVTFEPGQLSEIPGLLDGTFFNAAIFTNTIKEDDDFLAKTELPYPAILIGREIPNYSCFVPSLNAGKVAANSLVETGVKAPAILFSRQLTQAIQNRIAQFTEEINTNTGNNPLLIKSLRHDEKAAHTAVMNALQKEVSFDGLFAVHDSLAAGAYLALKERGIKIPEDVKVVGIGDSEIGPHLAPPLSCAGAEESRVYEKAAALILELIEDPAAKPKTVRTNARFVRRGSV